MSSAAAPSASGLAAGESMQLSAKPGSKAAPIVASINAQQLRITELENENARLKSEMTKIKSNMEKINKWCTTYAENYETTMTKIKNDRMMII
jgi:FtsZ-binding cell division protein ZapB